MPLLVHLLLFLSLHACSARPLQVSIVEGTAGRLQHSGKERRTATVGEYSRVVKEKMIDQGTTLASCRGENTILHKMSEELGGRNGKHKGKNMVVSSAIRVMHDMTKTEDKGSQARILEYLTSDNAEETMGAKENDMGEDIVVMDYAQPHRKPPIHNKQP